jgi:hypothetical protein
MLRLVTMRWGLLVLLIGACSVAQGQSQSQATAPAPAFGQNAPILDPENPPISGLDEPSLELRIVNRSFISPAIQVGQSVDSNGTNQLGGSDLTGVSHVLGALDLQKFWQRNDVFAEYLGGAAFGNNSYYVRQIQALGVEGVTRWRTGRATVRDSFTYLPDGSFLASTAGGLPGFGIATGGTSLGLPGIYRLSAVQGTLGTTPRLSNTAILDAVQSITPRSAFTLIGAFSNSHFYHNNEGLLNGDQTTGEVGYSHLISRHDQLAGVYAFQLLRFPTINGGEVYNHVLNLRWSHTISGRMSFIGGIGPQYTDVRYGTTSLSWNLAARATLHYRFEHTQLLLNYEKYTSQGSGFFPGADTQVVHVTIRRPLGRTYALFTNFGYSHNKRLLDIQKGLNANSYNDSSAGVILRKHIGRDFDLFAAYHFSEVWFDTVDKSGAVVGTNNQRHIGTIGVEWHPRPVRIE